MREIRTHKETTRTVVPKPQIIYQYIEKPVYLQPAPLKMDFDMFMGIVMSIGLAFGGGCGAGAYFGLPILITGGIAAVPVFLLIVVMWIWG